MSDDPRESPRHPLLPTRTPRSLLLGLVLLALGLAACSGARPAAATQHDRAACVQLGVAYDRFNAWTDGPPPSADYRNAIAVAKRADNRQLRDAIVGWVTAMRAPTTGKTAAGAVYATEECRQIGLPLRFRSRVSPTRSTTPSTSGSSDGGDDG